MNRSGKRPGCAWAWRPMLPLLLCAVALPALASPSNKWRIEADGRARVGGEIELSITPAGGTPTNVVVAVPAGASENTVARLIRDSIRTTFGNSVYHAEVDDGEDTLVKARGSTPDFEIVVIRNTAEGIRLDLDRE